MLPPSFGAPFPFPSADVSFWPSAAGSTCTSPRDSSFTPDAVILPPSADTGTASGSCKPIVAPARPPPPNRDPADWECSNTKCRNINFKKRTKCNLCGTIRADQKTEVPLTIHGPPGLFKAGDWACPSCGNVNWDWRDRCNICNNLKPELQDKREGGLGGGYYDRQDPQDKKQWDSDDEEIDDFGRRKRKWSEPNDGNAAETSLTEQRKAKREAACLANEEKKRKQQAALERLYSKAKGRTRSRSPQRDTNSRETRQVEYQDRRDKDPHDRREKDRETGRDHCDRYDKYDRHDHCT